jgi:hypothetical protein
MDYLPISVSSFLTDLKSQGFAAETVEFYRKKLCHSIGRIQFARSKLPGCRLNLSSEYLYRIFKLSRKPASKGFPDRETKH